MKIDWLITGSGGQAVVDEGGSKRCQLTASKLMLWTTRNNLINADIVGLIKLVQVSGNIYSGFVLRCDNTCNNAYYCRITCTSSYKVYQLYRIVNGVYTLLATVNSADSPSVYTKVRFRVDGNQISIEEYNAGTGNYNLIQLVTDTYITVGGYAGLKSDSVSGYSMLYDDIIISERP
jgi:hypothetical protein